MTSISNVKIEIDPFMEAEFGHTYKKANDLCNKTLTPSYKSTNAAMTALHDLKTKLVPLLIEIGKTNTEDSNVLRRIDVKTNDLWIQESEEQEARDTELERLQETFYTKTNDPAADEARQNDAAAQIWKILIEDNTPPPSTTITPHSSLVGRIFRCFKTNISHIISTIRNKLVTWKKCVWTKL